MALRIRKNGQIFCSAHSQPEEGDLHLSDYIHERLAGAFEERTLEPTFDSLDYNWDTHEYLRTNKIHSRKEKEEWDEND